MRSSARRTEGGGSTIVWAVVPPPTPGVPRRTNRPPRLTGSHVRSYYKKEGSGLPILRFLTVISSPFECPLLGLEFLDKLVRARFRITATEHLGLLCLEGHI